MNRTIATVDHLLINHTNNALGSGNTQHFRQHLGPFPGTHEANSETKIDQIKEIAREFEGEQGIHHMELHTVSHLTFMCLSTSKIDHTLADIHPDERHLRIGSSGFHSPIARCTGNIKDAPKLFWVILF